MNKVSEAIPPEKNVYSHEDMTFTTRIMGDEIKELKERNKSLQEDYEELREKNRGLRLAQDGLYNLFLDEIKEADALIPDGFSNHLEVCYDAIEKLKKDIEELEFSLDGMTHDRDAKEEEGDKLYQENTELKEENEELKEKNRSLNIQKQGWHDWEDPDWGKKYALKQDYQRIVDETKELKKENDRLNKFLDKRGYT
jgi:FtsZ-binding cell division protein ZapB